MLRLVVSKLPPHKPLMGREWIGPLQMGLKSPAQIVPQRHPTPTPEEVFAGVQGKVFARLDLRDAYLQQELEADSKDITTVTTHIGRLRMNRLPFGISECCGIFQSAIDQILEGIDGCVAYLDDLLVTGENEATS
ncbi:uncharacterized protein K02A2.6-like [Amphibalanus amphitrite]|uniref:uncharacterized protein K02A2.6-like n=1 Tax=Amphibalanus amphitrite TaxID=1232801 RepID=UPI001C924440|nr:uncharacterized protein K02A2.6-like [Amphibalanus amphitrite]